MLEARTGDASEYTPRLGVVVVSTRPGRVGPAVARWFVAAAERQGRFAIDLIDLADLNLPMFDEPAHPRMRKYTKEHTLRWSARVDALDALVFVMPEYNFAITAPLKNALDYLHTEWHYKPAGFVSYGGVSAGTRAVQMAKEVITTLKMMPVPEAVNIPFVRQFLSDEGEVQANEVMEDAARMMLDELALWEEALRGLRRRAPSPVAH